MSEGFLRSCACGDDGIRLLSCESVNHCSDPDDSNGDDIIVNAMQIDDINRIRKDLAENGIDSQVVKLK